MTPEQQQQLAQITAANENLVRAYKLAFGSPAGQAVIQDLINYCHAADTTYGHDFSIEILEGRRQVFLRIQSRMNLTADDLERITRENVIRFEQQEGA